MPSWWPELAWLLCIAAVFFGWIALLASLSGPSVVIEVPAGTKVEVIQR